MKALVTGATGLVGYHSVKALLPDCQELIALVRKTSDDRALRALSGNLRIIAADLSDSQSLRPVFAGVDLVVHAAALVDPHASREEIYAVNVEVLKNLLAVSDAGGVKHFIHISSLSVITGQSDVYNANESSPLKYCGESYADSKVDAEKACSMYFGRGNMMVTILRPGFIYGPGERAWMPRLLENLRTGKAMLIDGGLKESNVIYVENLVKAIQLAMLNPCADKEVFNLTDGEKVSKKLLFDTICDGMGFKRITRQVPGWLAEAACNFVSFFAPYLPAESRAKLSRFSRAAFRLAGLNQGFDISKAESTLGYTRENRIPFVQGMSETLLSFKEQKDAENRKRAGVS